MKILQVCNKVPWPEIDGGAIATLSMAKGLAENGVEVHILAMNTIKHRINPDQIPTELSSHLHFHIINIDARITRAGIISNYLFSKVPYTASRFISKEFEQELIRVLRNDQFDLVQLEGLYLCPYINAIRKNSHAAVSYRAHNIESEIWGRIAQKEKNIFKRIYLKSLSRRITSFEQKQLNHYDFLVPITKRDEEQFKRLGNHRPSIAVPVGIRAEDYKPFIEDTNAEDLINLNFIGALDWAPNQEGLLWFFKNCWPRLLKGHPQLHIRVAGRNAPAWLQEKLSLIKNCKYAGEVENAHSFICSSDIFLVPLLSGSGMRVKIIEAMALGRAIISTPVGCEGIQCSNKENILIAESVDDYISMCELAISNKELRKKLMQNARNFILQHYDNKSLTAGLVSFFKTPQTEK